MDGILRKSIWSNLTNTGLEHFYLWRGDDEITADGIVLGVEEDVEFRVHYKIICDIKWQVREVAVRLLDRNERAVSLASDGFGNWRNEFGEPVSELQGCFDVDITATPFTNTLPIRRLNLRPGESSEIKVVYFTIPEMRVTVEAQRYTCLEAGSAGGKYKFESLADGFTAVLTVDADGLVEDYPNLFKRVWTN